MARVIHSDGLVMVVTKSFGMLVTPGEEGHPCKWSKPGAYLTEQTGGIPDTARLGRRGFRNGFAA